MLKKRVADRLASMKDAMFSAAVEGGHTNGKSALQPRQLFGTTNLLWRYRVTSVRGSIARVLARLLVKKRTTLETGSR
jgi:hypothetical protein